MDSHFPFFLSSEKSKFPSVFHDRRGLPPGDAGIVRDGFLRRKCEASSSIWEILRSVYYGVSGRFEQCTERFKKLFGGCFRTFQGVLDNTRTLKRQDSLPIRSQSKRLRFPGLALVGTMEGLPAIGAESGALSVRQACCSFDCLGCGR